mmetsp:Transcript_7898/g.23358  ORF Transcript_7898/g.23358 Transcript_7898/m.23358 type:complete len:281 (-) Transcript_7898:119-961(-)
MACSHLAGRPSLPEEFLPLGPRRINEARGGRRPHGDPSDLDAPVVLGGLPGSPRRAPLPPVRIHPHHPPPGRDESLRIHLPLPHGEGVHHARQRAPPLAPRRLRLDAGERHLDLDAVVIVKLSLLVPRPQQLLVAEIAGARGWAGRPRRSDAPSEGGQSADRSDGAEGSPPAAPRVRRGSASSSGRLLRRRHRTIPHSDVEGLPLPPQDSHDVLGHLVGEARGRSHLRRDERIDLPVHPTQGRSHPALRGRSGRRAVIVLLVAPHSSSHGSAGEGRRGGR